ncbi:DUF1659 domain-containing protein [Pseudalkalibacillus berkeleyi]|uniref:DUF1659 domain-containing protein n=1 Tax=Pseudalkalibacillus berkeleyi TaxID=1069813 RepID=A0ABS9GVH2_9BACL|nr:DUF1659 domain-containing protein [Pseudalkalibacillus berkeleyi]MCF6136813.1 DUF1659 domain-containing protein [Pseudalkalibacillus berkeleyi]
MATAVLDDTRLTITFDAGVDNEGKPVYKRKNFNNIKTTATHDQMFEMVQALAPLQQYPVSQIERSNAFDLSE